MPTSDSNRRIRYNCAPTRPAKVFVLHLRLGGMFLKPVPAAIVGTLLCISTVGVLVSAIVLANNDRLADARAERADSSAAGDNIDTSSTLDNTTAPQQAGEGETRQQEDSALETKSLQSVVVQGSSTPNDESGSQVEESKNAPSEPDDGGGPSSWLACVVGGNLCLGDPKNGEEAL